MLTYHTPHDVQTTCDVRMINKEIDWGESGDKPEMRMTCASLMGRDIVRKEIGEDDRIRGIAACLYYVCVVITQDMSVTGTRVPSEMTLIGRSIYAQPIIEQAVCVCMTRLMYRPYEASSEVVNLSKTYGERRVPESASGATEIGKWQTFGTAKCLFC